MDGLTRDTNDYDLIIKNGTLVDGTGKRHVVARSPTRTLVSRSWIRRKEAEKPTKVIRSRLQSCGCQPMWSTCPLTSYRFVEQRVGPC